MQPRKPYLLLSGLFMVLLLASCSEGNKFASSFGKRRYTKGYYVDFPSGKPSTATIFRNTEHLFTPSPIVSKQAELNTTTSTLSVKGNPLIKAPAYIATSIKHYETNLVKAITASDTTQAPSGKYKKIDDYNIPALAGLTLSLVAVILFIIAQSFTTLPIIIGSIGLLLCIYSFFLHKVYLNWMGAIGIIMFIIMFTLILL